LAVGIVVAENPFLILYQVFEGYIKFVDLRALPLRRRDESESLEAFICERMEEQGANGDRHVTTASALAEQHRKMAEPGSGRKK
jgi:hypothetical protein